MLGVAAYDVWFGCLHFAWELGCRLDITRSHVHGVGESTTAIVVQHMYRRCFFAVRRMYNRNVRCRLRRPAGHDRLPHFAAISRFDEVRGGACDRLANIGEHAGVSPPYIHNLSAHTPSRHERTHTHSHTLPCNGREREHTHMLDTGSGSRALDELG